jgi:hypothetical protein
LSAVVTTDKVGTEVAVGIIWRTFVTTTAVSVEEIAVYVYAGRIVVICCTKSATVTY